MSGDERRIEVTREDRRSNRSFISHSAARVAPTKLSRLHWRRAGFIENALHRQYRE